jgi:CheY-like chemotaxis protein
MNERAAPTAILSVEDEAVNQVLLREVLARASVPALREAKLDEATTLAEGRDALRRSRYDLVLLDVRLPDGSGLELARQLEGSAEPRPKVVILSASVLATEREAAMAAGCDAFLAKPYAATELIDLLATLLAA